MNAIVEYETDHGKVQLSPQIIKNYLVAGDPNKVTGQEVMMFLMLCKHQRLNPSLREAYLIKYGNEKATIVTGKEVFTKRAAASPLCEGWEAGIIVKDAKGVILNREGTFMAEGEELVGGWAKVYRKDWKVPISATVSMTEYQRLKADGTPMASWRAMPATMIRKVALVQGLRDAFPEDFQGMYSPEEMPIDSAALDEKPVKAETQEEEAIDAEVVVSNGNKMTQSEVKEMFGVSDNQESRNDPEPANVKKITEKQRKLLFARSGGNEAIVRAVIAEYGYESTADIPMKLMDEILPKIESAAKDKKFIDDAVDAIDVE
jgi:phage recombination protein Bet